MDQVISMNSDKINVIIYQPAVPNYRVPFFNFLFQNNKYIYSLIAGNISPDGVSTHKSSIKLIEKICPLYTFINNNIYYYKGMMLPEYLKSGDIIVLAGNLRIINTLLILIRSKIKGLKLVWFGHGWTAGGSRFGLFLRKKIMMTCDACLLYTEKEVDSFIKYGFNEKKLFGLNNTIDTNEIDQLLSENELCAIIERCKQDKKKRILFVGRLTKKSCLDILIKALAIMSSEYHLIVIGDGDYCSEYKDISKKYNVENKIEWLGNIEQERELANWFLSSSLFVYPGSIGLSIMHAFAYSLPVITHDDEKYQMPEFSALINNVNGITFERNNYSDLANKVEKYFDDEIKMIEMKKSARETIDKKYNMKNMTDNFIKALDALSI